MGGLRSLDGGPSGGPDQSRGPIYSGCPPSESALRHAQFRRGNTFGTTAFVSYGSFWMSFAGYVKFVFTAYMSVAAMKLDLAHRLLFVVPALTFLFLALGDLSEVTALGRTGGFLGLLCAGIAWYVSFAGVAAETWGRKVLPLG
ncbi:acetate uptake transporter family protein [Streptomyces sp. NPDC059385]|uniref:acetate uptake transporter family protein n=1 Tax=Streptomyces sp. NPDC059385 TaxID=3346817 RepID=UPI0036828C13